MNVEFCGIDCVVFSNLVARDGGQTTACIYSLAYLMAACTVHIHTPF